MGGGAAARGGCCTLLCICLTMNEVQGRQAGAIVAGVPMSTPAGQRGTCSIPTPWGSRSHSQRAPGMKHPFYQHNIYIIPVDTCCSCPGSPDTLVSMHAIALQAAREIVGIVCSASWCRALAPQGRKQCSMALSTQASKCTASMLGSPERETAWREHEHSGRP